MSWRPRHLQTYPNTINVALGALGALRGDAPGQPAGLGPDSV